MNLSIAKAYHMNINLVMLTVLCNCPEVSFAWHRIGTFAMSEQATEMQNARAMYGSSLG